MRAPYKNNKRKLSVKGNIPNSVQNKQTGKKKRENLSIIFTVKGVT